MYRVDVFVLYKAGKNLHALASLEGEKIKLGSVVMPHLSARRAIATLLSDFTPAKLEISKSAALNVRHALDDFEKVHFTKPGSNEFAWPDDDVFIYGFELNPIQKAISEFEAVFKAEVQVAAIYRVPKKGTFDIADLVDNGSKTFPEELNLFIGRVALAEYDAASRCFAFGLYSASGYHSCRAVEAVLKSYYHFFTDKHPPKKPWGDLLKVLEGLENRKPDEKTLSHINHIKKYNRNPLSHLDAVLDEIDADMLFCHAKIAIIAMAREMLDTVKLGDIETSSTVEVGSKGRVGEKRDSRGSPSSLSGSALLLGGGPTK